MNKNARTLQEAMAIHQCGECASRQQPLLEMNMSGKVIINGQSYELGPDDVVFMIGHRVYYNHQIVGKNDKMPEVKLEGDPLNVYGIGPINITGSVKGNVDTNGAVTCGPVGGNVDTNAMVKCGTVGGNVDTNGSVEVSGDCGDINTTGAVKVSGNCKGNIDTMGKVTVGSKT